MVVKILTERISLDNDIENNNINWEIVNIFDTSNNNDDDVDIDDSVTDDDFNTLMVNDSSDGNNTDYFNDSSSTSSSTSSNAYCNFDRITYGNVINLNNLIFIIGGYCDSIDSSINRMYCIY